MIAVVGAGCAGLACARDLAEAGVAPVVLDKSKGVGGRAATRRIEGQSVDHGLAFYHGSDPSFLEALDAVSNATPLEGWPHVIVGEGSPCLPRAFEPGERRLAFAEGVTAFPKFLARGLDVRRRSSVVAVAYRDGAFALSLADGEVLEADTVVLALPVEQALVLLNPLANPEGSRAVDSARALISKLKSEPCLTLIAGYPLTAPAPAWDMNYPADSDVLTLLAQDSRKRLHKRFHAFVLQCSPGFSRRHLEQDASTWSKRVLDEARRLLGGWAHEPSFVKSHRWRYARDSMQPTLTSPLVITWPSGARLALTGDIFSPGGGVEAAYLAGRALASQLIPD